MIICKKCNSELVVMVQYGYMPSDETPCHYDGVSEYLCKNCDYREGRWTGKELKGDEHEPVFGGAHKKNCPMYQR